MMKIHTTQNLNALGIVNQQKELLSQRTSDYCSAPQRFSNIQENQLYDLTFQGKSSKAAKKLIGKAIEATKENLNTIIKKDKKLDPTGGRKGRFYEWTEENEVLVNSLIALLLTVIGRPLTNEGLSRLSKGKDKKDYAYASGHSICSGVIGLLFTLLCINPFVDGYKLAKEHPEKYLNKLSDKEYIDWFKRRFPQVNEKTLFSVKDGKKIRNPFSKILDMCGNPISTDVKDVMKIPLPKHGTETAPNALKEVFGTSSWEDIVNKKCDLPDKLDGLFLCVETEGEKGKLTQKYYPLKYIKEDLLKELLPDLDINSIKNAKGERLSLRDWKNTKGDAFDIDRNNLFISSWESTDKSIPLIIGETRVDKETTLLSKIKEITKDVCYQNNNNDGLGTPITQEMVDADRANDVHNKLGGWFMDPTLAVPRSILTIATIPFILKNVFHLEKAKKTDAPQQETVQAKNVVPAANQDNQAQAVAFKGKKGDPSWLNDLMAKTYGTWILTSKKMRKFSESLSKNDTTNATKHFSVFGSLITSTTYAITTIKSKCFDKDNARTLAINQILGWVAPTICGYLAETWLQEKNKEKEYDIAAKLTKAIDLSNLNPEERTKAIKRMAKMLKGVRTLTSIATFVLIYRYAFPVIVTPIANFIGKKIKNSKASKASAQNDVNNVQSANIKQLNATSLPSAPAKAV